MNSHFPAAVAIISLLAVSFGADTMPLYANEIYLTCKSTKNKSYKEDTHLGTYNKESGFYKETIDIEENKLRLYNVFVNKELNSASIDGEKGEINYTSEYISIRIPPEKEGEIRSIRINRSNLDFIYYANYPLGELYGIVKRSIVNASGKCKKNKPLQKNLI